MADKVIRYDFDTISEDGSDNLTTTIMKLLNAYPRLKDDEIIEFQILDTSKGVAMFPSSSVAILSERVDITDHVEQTCSYGFLVVSRIKSSSANKKERKEWLDDLGRWLEKQEIKVGDEIHKLVNYPQLEGDKEFISFKRSTQSYLYGTTEDKSEDWAISISATYRNEYDK